MLVLPASAEYRGRCEMLHQDNKRESNGFSPRIWRHGYKADTCLVGKTSDSFRSSYGFECLNLGQKQSPSTRE